jgi:hypothetical protein
MRETINVFCRRTMALKANSPLVFRIAQPVFLSHALVILVFKLTPIEAQLGKAHCLYSI